MRIRHARFLLFAAVVSSCPACMAPGVPAAPAVAPAGVGPAAIDGAPLAAAAAPATGLEKCCETLDKCRRKLCATPFGQMLNSMTKPASALTGGVIPTFCPGIPGLDDLMKPGVLGESAAVAKDAAEAKARRAAVRLLGTVDCRYYPEVEGKLLAALRTDGSECVRYEAALALSHGCCCSKKVIDILTICVDGGEEDGAPAERSDRVRDTAMIGLQRCLSCVKVVAEPVVLPEPDTKKPEDEIDAPKKKDAPPKLPDSEPKAENDKPKKDTNKADMKTVAKARDVIARRQAVRQEEMRNTPAPSPVHSVFEMFKYADEGPSISSTATPATAPATTTAQAPATTEGLRVAKPVNPLQARVMPAAPTMPAKVQAPAPAITATVMSPAPMETPVVTPVIPSAGYGPVLPALPTIEPGLTPVSDPVPVPMPIPEPQVTPASATAPVIPDAPAAPAVPMLPAVAPAPMVQAEAPTAPSPVIIRPSATVENLPPTQLGSPSQEPVIPPTVIIRPQSPAMPLPTSPFPD